MALVTDSEVVPQIHLQEVNHTLEQEIARREQAERALTSCEAAFKELAGQKFALDQHASVSGDRRSGHDYLRE